MKKSKHLNQWFWKWHIIAGLFCMPIIAMLCITGSVYLFESHFNNYAYRDARFVSVPDGDKNVSFATQLKVAQEYADHPIMSVTLPASDEQATAFRQHAKAHSRNLVYVDPYTNIVNGTYRQKETLMYTVRKLHGELLLGFPGTLLVELVASWFIVLALTGIYVWWPAGGFSNIGSMVKGFFAVRTKHGRRVFWRDMHSVLAFWMSVFMLIILAGGMPWTDLFGDNLKWVQKQTNTGYPEHWRSSKGLESNTQEGSSTRISLDQVVEISQTHHLPGEITIKFPDDESGVFTLSNRAPWLEDQQVLHIDQYSGDVIKALTWNQVGILMELRQIFMRLHQGQYGVLNLVIVLLVAITFFVATMASLISYLSRKPKGEWGIPKAPENFRIGMPILTAIGVLAIVFPMFGSSVILILLTSSIGRLINDRILSRRKQ